MTRPRWARDRAEAQAWAAVVEGEEPARLVTTTGEARVFRDDAAMRRWMAAHGTVEAYAVEADTCPGCGGHAELRSAPYDYDKCAVCDGSGRFRWPDESAMDEEAREEFQAWLTKVGL